MLYLVKSNPNAKPLEVVKSQTCQVKAQRLLSKVFHPNRPPPLLPAPPLIPSPPSALADQMDSILTLPTKAHTSSASVETLTSTTASRALSSSTPANAATGPELNRKLPFKASHFGHHYLLSPLVTWSAHLILSQNGKMIDRLG